MKRPCRRNGFSWIETVIVTLILAVLLALAIPAALRVRLQGAQMKDLNNGKQIYLGLKLFATDNDGRFPWADFDPATGGPALSGNKVSSSNAAFQNICPQYISQRATFYVENSAWTPVPPAQRTSAAPLTRPGENAYAYVPGLNVNSNAAFPLIADAFSKTVGVYSNVKGQKGSLWKGQKALVIRVDGSTAFESCHPQTFKVWVQPGTPELFTPAPDWIPQAPVNPL